MRKITRLGMVSALLAAGAWMSIVPDAAATSSPTDTLTNHVVRRTPDAAFTADGVNTGGEYAAVDMLNVGGNNFMEAKVSIKRFRDTLGNEELRIYFSVHDNDFDANDRIEFYFDRLHDQGTKSGATVPTTLLEDLQLTILRPMADCGSAGVACTTGITLRGRDPTTGLFSGAATPVSLSQAVIKTANAGEYSAAPAPYNNGWTGELVLKPADLGWGYFPDVVGFLVRATSGNVSGINAMTGTSPTAGQSASYPLSGTSVVGATAADLWANLKLRYPIDYGLIMDFSGSMLALDGFPAEVGNRWQRAKRAADLFHAVSALFKDNFLDDKIAIMQYAWTCGNNADAGNLSGNLQGGVTTNPQDIPATPPTGTTSLTGAAVDPAPSNCTPIQQGLTQALESAAGISHPGMYGAVTVDPNDPKSKRDRILVLLSDGLHNMPSSALGFTPATAGDPFSTDEKTLVHVRTVALGPDGKVGTDLLNAISNAFKAGGAEHAKYNNPLTFPDLVNAYFESIATAINVNKVDDISLTNSFLPGEGEKLVLIGVWNKATDAGRLKAQRDGVDVPVPSAQQPFNTKIGYAAVVVNKPQPGGTWSLALDGAASLPQQMYAFADLREFAQFLVEQKPYHAGQPILLQVRLKDRDKPILGAEVTVEVAKPGEGLGNYLSTVQPDCSTGSPSIPGDGVVLKNAANAVRSTAAGTTTTSTAAAGDPISGRYALAADAFSRCNKNGLNRLALPGLKLYDDGTHGDPIPGDGIYSLAFTDTNLEGSYTMRFHVRAKNSDGIDFTRTRTTSQFVGIQPDPGATNSTMIAGPIVGNLQTASIYFLPKDLLGNYVGPGFAGAFTVSVQVGQLVGTLKDVGNGYYVQTVQYAPSGPSPVITVAMPGTCFEKVIDTGARPWWLLWVIAIIILLILLFFILWLLARRP